MKILEVCVDLDGGGIDRYLYNYCSRIKGIQFDFAVVDSKRDGILEPSLRSMGYNIFRVPRLSLGIKNNYRALKSIMENGQYDIVHVHLGYKSFVALKCAKDCGIKNRIVHAHIAYVPETKRDKLIRMILTKVSKHYATDLAACGDDAARWVWGEKAYNKGLVTIHNNAIETKKYAYDSTLNMKYRQELNIPNDRLVIGHVGRISDQKNQLRLLEIFKEIHNMRQNSCLVLIGRGELEATVSKKISELNLDDSVYMLGVRNDVAELLNIMDVFVFPSKYEGLPFTLVETQCNGLMAIVSDTVTRYVKLGDCVEFLGLNESNHKWAEKSIAAAELGHDVNARKSVIDAGYDIDVAAEHLKEYYLNLGEE